MKSIDMLHELLQDRDYCTVEKNDSEGNLISVSIEKRQPRRIKNLNIKEIDFIPKDYIEFLSFSDGMDLFNYDNIDGLRLLSLEEIEKYTCFAPNTFEEEWEEGICIFAKIIGEDNYLGFKMKGGKCQILDCYFEETPSEWSIIANGFDEFLEHYISEKGNKFWIF